MKRIFVSSTFKDMQAERDALHMEVLPELNEFAARYGQSVAISDLRWGIDTGRMSEEESSRKVLGVCFEQIDECKPYMLVLLGDRYGFVPFDGAGEGETGNIAGIGNAAGLSVTEMEILYGALRKGDLSRCVFYFRRPLEYAAMGACAADYTAESESHARKLDALKRKIEATAGERVRFYTAAWDAEKQAVTGLEAFSRGVIADIEAMMKAEWEREAKLTREELERNAAWQYVAAKAAGFKARRAEETAFCGDIRNDAAELSFVTGAAGSGKSCFLSRVALDMREEGWQVLPFVAGNGGGSTTLADLLRRLNAFLAAETGGEAPAGAVTFSVLREAFTGLAGRYSASNKRLLVVIDALDQMAASDELRDFTWLIPSLPRNIRFALSCPDDFPLPKGMPYSLRDKRVQLRPLDDATEKRALIDGMMEASGKTLPTEVTRALIRLPGADSPLYLSMFVQRLMMLDAEDFRQIRSLGTDGDAINAYLMKLVREAPAETAGMCAAILQEAAQRINGTQVELTLGLTAVSRRGLRETDLITLFSDAGLRFSTVDHARMRKYMRAYFLLREDGRLDFSHRTIREGFLAQRKDAAELERRLLDYWIRLPAADPLRQSELPYHAMRLNDRDAVLTMMGGDGCTPVTLRELHDLSMTDRGRWMASLIDRADADGRSVRVIRTMMGIQREYDATAAELAVLTPLLEKTIAAAEAVPEGSAESFHRRGTLFSLWFDLGKAYYDQGMPTKALECYRKSAAQGRTDQTDDPGTGPEGAAGTGVTVDGETYTVEESAWLARANVQEEMGHAYNRLDRLDEALESYRESHELILRLLPQAQDHPSVWQALAVGCSELCRAYRRLRRLAEARPYAEEGVGYALKAVEAEPSVLSRRTLSALYGDLGDVFFLEQQWEESYDYFSRAYTVAAEIVREKNDAQSRQDLAFSARKRGDALVRMGSASRAKALYLESIRLVAYEPEELLSPASRRMLTDTAVNFGFLRALDFGADTLLYNAVANLLTLLKGFTEVPAGSEQYGVNLGLLCDALSTVLGLASFKEDAETLRIKAGEYLGEARADDVPDDDGALAAKAARTFREGDALLADGRFPEARERLQQAAELYSVLDTRQPAFTPTVAKCRADVVLTLSRTYFPEKNYREIAGAYNFCHAQYERIYQTTREDGALLDLVAMKRAAAELLEALGQTGEAVQWIRAAVKLLAGLKRPEGGPAAPAEAARCAMTEAALTRTEKRERRRLWKRAEEDWRKAYARKPDPAYLEQAERCVKKGGEGENGAGR